MHARLTRPAARPRAPSPTTHLLSRGLHQRHVRQSVSHLSAAPPSQSLERTKLADPTPGVRLPLSGWARQRGARAELLHNSCACAEHERGCSVRAQARAPSMGARLHSCAGKPVGPSRGAAHLRARWQAGGSGEGE